MGLALPKSKGTVQPKLPTIWGSSLMVVLSRCRDVAGEFQEEDEYIGINLTWDGQDFLRSSRDNALWKKAKETIINSGVGFTVQSLLAWLKAQVLM